jgi:hypothetical protein
MTSTDIIALVGAAAWLPQIATWIYRAAIRPRIRIIPDKHVEIGFTTFGPIFNLRVGFSAERKDAIVDGISVELTHESGATHRLDWSGMLENFSQIIGPAGIRQSVERESPPIAIKLSTITLQEKLIRFQESRFHDSKRPLESAVFNHLNYLRSRTDKFREETLNSKETQTLLDLYRQAFWWKAGTYKLVFLISSPDRAGVEKEVYTFSLSQSDIDDLGCNINTVKLDLAAFFNIDLEGFKYPTIPWNWKNLALRPGTSASIIKHRH